MSFCANACARDVWCDGASRDGRRPAPSRDAGGRRRVDVHDHPAAPEVKVDGARRRDAPASEVVLARRDADERDDDDQVVEELPERLRVRLVPELRPQGDRDLLSRDRPDALGKPRRAGKGRLFLPLCFLCRIVVVSGPLLARRRRPWSTRPARSNQDLENEHPSYSRTRERSMRLRAQSRTSIVECGESEVLSRVGVAAALE